MKISNPLFWVVLFSFLIAACGELRKKYGRLEEEGVTTVDFAVDRPYGSLATLNGGMMIYAVRADNPLRRASRYFSSDSAVTTWTLPNGQYTFHAVGYTGSSMTGNYHCGSSSLISLGGNSTTVPIVMDDGGVCGTVPFSVSGTSNNVNTPKILRVHVCGSAGGDISTTTDSVLCTSGGQPPSATSQSVRFSLIEYSALDGGSPNMNLASNFVTSGCVSGSFTGSTTGASSDTKLVPYGLPFVSKLEAYSDAGCGTSLGAVYLLHGLQGIANNSLNRYFGASSGAFIATPGPTQGFLYTGSTTANFLFMREIP